MLEYNALDKEFLEKIKLKRCDIYIVNMSKKLQDSLDYSTKLNRNTGFINRLIADGEKQGKLFLKNPESCREEGEDFLSFEDVVDKSSAQRQP